MLGIRSPALPSNDIKSFAEYLKTCKNVIVMSGAGISTTAGIPDFRSPEFGLYDKLSNYKLPHPTAVFSLDYFKRDPRPFYEIANELYPALAKARPTKTHYFIKLLFDKGILLRHYTQNVDALDDLTGLPEDKIVQAHGHIKTGSCLKCSHKHSFEFMKGFVVNKEIPKCESCGDVVKPDVVLFGESLPARFWKHLIDFRRCDCLIICGTSLVVQPFAGLAGKVGSNVPRLLINRDEVGDPNMFGSFMTNLFGLDPKFDTSGSSRPDVFFKGDCDEGCAELAKLLGWEDDLNKLVENDKKFAEDNVMPHL